MDEITTMHTKRIEDMIYEVRGMKVMMDSDVAMLFGYQTKDLNRTVKNNLNRFPENYCFRVTEEEYNFLRCNFFTLKKSNGRGEHRKYLPYVFTEHGITMLAGLLKSDVAVEASLRIVNTFIAMKKYISNSLLEQNYINNMVLNHDERIKVLENTFLKFETFSNELFFEGQIYDANSLLLDIFNTSNKSIVIIDNYISKELLDVICKTNKQITVHTKNIDKHLINKYQSQYNNLTIKINKSFHNRFIIIDDTTLYHSGASFKDLGKKCFAISKIDNLEMIKDIEKHL